MRWLRVQWDGCREFTLAVVNAVLLRPHYFHNDGMPCWRCHLAGRGRR